MSNPLPANFLSLIQQNRSTDGREFGFSSPDSPYDAASKRANQLLAVSTALSSAITSEQVVGVIVQAALAIFNGHVGLVALVAPDEITLNIQQITGWSSVNLDQWRHLPITSKMPIADAIRERRNIVIATDEEYAREYPHMAHVHASAGGGATVAVPMIVGDRCLGGIGFLCKPEDCTLEEQQTFLSTLAAQCTLALDRARLYDLEKTARLAAVAEIEERKLVEESLRHAEDRLSIALKKEALQNKIGQMILGTHDPDHIQSFAVRELGKAINADRCYFSMTDFKKDSSWIGQDYCRQDLPSVSGNYRRSDYNVDPAVFHPDGKTLVVEDVNNVNWPKRFVDMLQSLRIRAAIKVPFYTEGKMTARLVVAMADEPREWTADEVSLVESVAAQTRAAINAAQIQEQEHRIAEQLQNALMPVLPSSAPGLQIGAITRPALDEAAVGGDFYDVFQIDAEHVALIIGDVSGKGLAAAQQLALMRNSVRTALYILKSPETAASTLNKIVTSHNLIAGFVTLFIGVVNTTLSQMTYCSCGHEPALLKRGVDGSITLLEATGYPIGVLPEAEYTEQIVPLSPGDELLLHTDGLSEAGPNRQQLLGNTGMAKLWQAVEGSTGAQLAAQRIVDEVCTISNGAFTDDVAILIIKCLDDVICAA